MRNIAKAELTLLVLIVITGGVCQKAPAPAQPVATPASQATASSAVAAVASASDFYVATNGSGTACALAAPCSLATGIGAGSPARPGDKIWLRGGTYAGTFVSSLTGTASSPIKVQQYPGERATLDGNAITTLAVSMDATTTSCVLAANIFGANTTIQIDSEQIYLWTANLVVQRGWNGTTAAPHSAGASVTTGTPTFTINGAYTWYIGFEITNSSGVRTTTVTGSGALNRLGASLSTHGPGTKLINLVIHDTWEGLSLNTDSPNSEVYGNLVYWTGWSAPDRGHGHLVYVQSAAPGTQTLRDNVMFESFDVGYQAYGSSNARLDNIYAEGNVVFASGNTQGGSGYTHNYLQGGGVQTVNGSWVSNFSYDPLGYGDQVYGYVSGCSGTSTIAGNYFFGSIAMKTDGGCLPTTMSGNTFIGGIIGFTQAQYPSNTYLPYPTVPTSTRIFVRPNAYEPGRANIIVYNWKHTTSVAVDLSAALSVGDQYEIRYVRNYFGTPVLAGTYAGGTVSLPMTGYSAGVPVGFPAPVTTLPEFGVFIVRKVAAQGPTPTLTPLPPTPQSAARHGFPLGHRPLQPPAGGGMDGTEAAPFRRDEDRRDHHPRPAPADTSGRISQFCSRTWSNGKERYT